MFEAKRAIPSQYKVYPLDDALDRFPGNSWRVFNLTRTPLALKAGDAPPQLIGVGGQHVFTTVGANASSEKIQIAVRHDEDWHLAYNSV